MPISDAHPESPLALDNSVFTLLRNKRPKIIENVKKHFASTKQYPAVPAITLFEARFGLEQEIAKKSVTVEAAEFYRKRIDELAEEYPILSLNQKAAEIAAYVFARLSQSDRNKHWRDLFIAATAIAHNFGLATQNKRDMELIAKVLPPNIDLRIAIWKN
jgi:predicted nucleic acid-binding protein